MPSWKWREVRSALSRKGFRLVRSSNHEYYRFVIQGTHSQVRTKISFGTKGELHSSSQLMSKLQQHLHLSSSEIQDLLNCPLSENAYARMMKDKGHLKPDD